MDKDLTEDEGTILKNVAHKLTKLATDIYREENIGCNHSEDETCFQCINSDTFHMDNLLEAINSLEEIEPNIRFIGHGEFGAVLSLKDSPTKCIKIYSKGDSYKHITYFYERCNNPIIYPKIHEVSSDKFVIMELVSGHILSMEELVGYVVNNEQNIRKLFDTFFDNLFKDYSNGIIITDLHIDNLMFIDGQIKLIDLDAYTNNIDSTKKQFTLTDFIICRDYHDFNDYIMIDKYESIMKEIIKTNLEKYNFTFIDIDDKKSNKDIISSDPLI